ARPRKRRSERTRRTARRFTKLRSRPGSRFGLAGLLEVPCRLGEIVEFNLRGFRTQSKREDRGDSIYLGMQWQRTELRASAWYQQSREVGHARRAFDVSFGLPALR